MITSVLAAIASLSTIIAAVYGILRLAAYTFSSTSEQTKEKVDEDVAKEQEAVKQTGRPQ